MTPSKTNSSTTATATPKAFTAPEHRATQDDIKKWQGWCRLQSEPSIFNVMLRKLEVKGVRVADVHDLDGLTQQPETVFGLLFLFPYRELNDEKEQDPKDGNNEEAATASFPSKLWFANQTTENACATVGLINILCNIPDIDRGEYIKHMMEHTEPLSPPLRGFVLSSWTFLRQLHNSFCTKADMLLADSAMEHDFNRYQQKSKAKAKKNSRKRKADAMNEDPSGENHFMGYIPCCGEVWRIDGLDSKPHSLGKYDGDGDWVRVARDNIQKYIDTARPEDQFNLTRLGPDPFVKNQQEFGSNIKSIQRIEERLGTLNSTWRKSLGGSEEAEGEEKKSKIDEVFSDTISELGITEGLLSEAAVKRAEEIEGAEFRELTHLRESLGKDQGALKNGIKQGREEWESDERRAEERKFDFGPFIRGFLRKVAEKGVLKEIVEDL